MYRNYTKTVTVPTCPACKIREVEADYESDGFFTFCGTCSGHRSSAPACNRPACLVGGHTSVKTSVVGYSDAEKKQPVYGCQQGCGKVGDAIFWAKRNAWFSALGTHTNCPDLVQTRLAHQRKAAAYRTGGPGLAATRTVEYAKAYVAYAEHLLAQG